MGRLKVEPDLSLPSYPNVFVAGDMSTFADSSGRQLPGVAPVAIQQGKHIGRLIRRELKGKPRQPFHYFDKGIMATIGRSKAVVSSHGIRLTGLIAWLIWAFVHIAFLMEFKNRVFVFFQWVWAYFSFGRGARLIVHKNWRFYDESEKG
jgi:NADH:ubiquinone reductase (H+-translocating)